MNLRSLDEDPARPTGIYTNHDRKLLCDLENIKAASAELIGVAPRDNAEVVQSRSLQDSPQFSRLGSQLSQSAARTCTSALGVVTPIEAVKGRCQTGSQDSLS
jgi:hypothetical protein